VNAADRLWRALERGDWAAARRQLSLHAQIESPPEAPVPADEYVARHRSAGPFASVAMLRAASDGNTVALEAEVERGARYRVLAFYDLHDAHIARGTEVWLRT
jgi:hypothetical protein